MKSKIELLAPGGDIDSIKAAILAGANAVYCGLDRFNARNRAENITFDDLSGILELAHSNNCEVFLTINIIIVESELPAFIKLLNKLVTTTIDGVIVQDLGALYLLKKHFPSLKPHASTQMTTHSEGQIKFLQELSVTRVNLSRELNLGEIKELTKTAHACDMHTEVFVHGANCISFSGLCYFSSVHGGNSGNRGRCSQQCRSQYQTTSQGNNFPLNMKDNSAFDHLDQLIDAGVDSLKIEGRIKKFDYVYTVVNTWRKHIDSGSSGSSGSSSCKDTSNLKPQTSNLKPQSKDTPCNSTQTSSLESQAQSKDTPCNGTSNKEILYKVFNRDLSANYLTGAIGADMFIDNPRDNSARNLARQHGDESKTGVDRARDEINAQRAAITDSIKETIATMKCPKITPTTSDKYKKINSPEIPPLRHASESIKKTTLSILISSAKELEFCQGNDATIYFQLPSYLEGQERELIKLFTENKQLIPWFPSILIGEQFHKAVEFIDKLRPKILVTDNTGIALEAQKRGIQWIAGPHLNIANSYSLKCLKEQFGCAGAFISNELSQTQIGGIKRPDNFELHYSIYHPQMLMTSRQCLFHTVSGCDKNIPPNECLQTCNKSSSITNMQGSDFIIKKERGNYHQVYNDTDFLNIDIAGNMQGRFTSFLIDLRDVQTKTTFTSDKMEIISKFKECLGGDSNAIEELKSSITPWSNTQYKKGI